METHLIKLISRPLLLLAITLVVGGMTAGTVLGFVGNEGGSNQSGYVDAQQTADYGWRQGDASGNAQQTADYYSQQDNASGNAQQADDYGNVQSQEATRDVPFSTFANPNQRGTTETNAAVQSILSDTIAELEKKVRQLQAQVETMERSESQERATNGVRRDQVTDATGDTEAEMLQPCAQRWQQDLRVGSVGEDVLYLQQFLNQYSAATRVASQGAGSPGNETTYFGPRTASALVRFQESYRADILVPNDLQNGTGYFGPSSRAKVRSMCQNMTDVNGASNTTGTETTTSSNSSRVIEEATSEPETTNDSNNVEYTNDTGETAAQTTPARANYSVNDVDVVIDGLSTTLSYTFNNGCADHIVDWGDGSVTENVSEDATANPLLRNCAMALTTVTPSHDYESAGTYTVTFTAPYLNPPYEETFTVEVAG